MLWRALSEAIPDVSKKEKSKIRNNNKVYVQVIQSYSSLHLNRSQNLWLKSSPCAICTAIIPSTSYGYPLVCHFIHVFMAILREIYFTIPYQSRLYLKTVERGWCAWHTAMSPGFPKTKSNFMKISCRCWSKDQWTICKKISSYPCNFCFVVANPTKHGLAYHAVWTLEWITCALLVVHSILFIDLNVKVRNKNSVMHRKVDIYLKKLVPSRDVPALNIVLVLVLGAKKGPTWLEHRQLHYRDKQHKLNKQVRAWMSPESITNMLCNSDIARKQPTPQDTL